MPPFPYTMAEIKTTPLTQPALLDELAHWIAELHHWQQRPPVIGISGAQGSGKSTLARQLAAHLTAAGQHPAILALDDLYLPRAQRLQVAERAHPLFATRGVPGTHDVALGLKLLDCLGHLDAGEHCALPVFDKLLDDRRSDLRVQTGPVDVVLFEGWCLGLTPQTDAALSKPVNSLEADEDVDARWRTAVNDHLRGDYRALFERIDGLVFLQVPDMDCVLGWRMQQEADNLTASTAPQQTMDTGALQRFVAHYERLTRHALDTVPGYADLVLELDHAHRIAGWRWR